MSRSNFSITGLNIGDNSTNMAYLYGISDFFSVMFEDTTKVNLLLESEAEAASSAYSKFLQLTSNISLQDIQATSGQTLKLVTIKSSDAVVGEVNVFKLPSKIVETRYIANRPLLPTVLMEDGVDYRIEKVGGEFRIRFSKDITNIGFSTRLLNDSVTKEFALWFVDTEIDEGWISNNYAALIGVDPTTSTEAFKNFIQGLYYIYLNGPTLELLRKGLNLCLGVPLARSVETVIDVRKYLETDQYIVVTDLNQYLIPYGLIPEVEAEDVLNVGDELAKWVEIKDYLHDGEWWINLKIPPKLIPDLPKGQIDRYATKGSHFDYLMRAYLKKHTFLVNVKVADFKNNQMFQEISDIISKAKPSYTESIYIWTVPNTETLNSTDERFTQQRGHVRIESITRGIEQFYRNNTVSPVSRGNPQFIKYNVSYETSLVLDGNTYAKQGLSEPNPLTGIVPANLHTRIKLAPNMNVIPLYVTTQDDLEYKCKTAGIYVPSIKEWVFDLFNPLNDSDSVNNLAVDDGRIERAPTLFKQWFDLFKERTSTVNYVSSLTPDEGMRMFSIFIEDITDLDYLVGVRIHDNAVGIYLATSNNPTLRGRYRPVEGDDPLTITRSDRPGEILQY
jgi:hypothetical protein